MIMIKPGANVSNLHPKVWDAIYKADPIFKEFDVNLVITSGNDSKHSTKSFHYIDLAVDLRTRHLSGGTAAIVTNKIKKSVGNEYDVILESNHIHLEYDPRILRHAST